MFTRADIEKLLEINGVSPSAPDDEIKSVLISARWHEDDIEAAITVLRENTKTHAQRVDKLHKVFYSDDRLQPETVSALLGIEANYSPHTIDRAMVRRQHGGRSLNRSQFLVVFMFGAMLALGVVIGMMWYLHMGLFYPVSV